MEKNDYQTATQDYQVNGKDFVQKDKVLLNAVAVNTLFEAIAEGIVVTNESGSIVTINSRLEDMTGFKKQEIEGKYLNELIPDRFQHKHTGHLYSYFRNPTTRPMGINLDLFLKRKDGTEFPVEISLGYLDLEDGRFAMAFITDISARKKAEDNLKKRNEELNAYSQTVAHEINSTLNVVVGLSSLLTESLNTNLNDEQINHLEVIRDSAEKVSSIVNELLFFAGTHSEDVELSRIDSTEIIRAVIARLRAEIDERKAEIILTEGIPVCLGYGPWVEEIWFNLISNALKYGGTPPEIRIFYTLKDNLIKFSVQDNGTGWINKTSKENSHNLNPDKKITGFGLGLPIVRRIIDKLGGTIEIQSSQDAGSTVSFTLLAGAKISLNSEHVTQ